MTPTLAPAVAPVAPETRPAETVTPLLPSEALRLGRLTRPERITGALFRDDAGACAIGAMLAGIGCGPSDLHGDQDGYVQILWAFPGMDVVVPFPNDSGLSGLDRLRSADVTSVVMELNDVARWSDNQIVEWLQELGL